MDYGVVATPTKSRICPLSQIPSLFRRTRPPSSLTLIPLLLLPPPRVLPPPRPRPPPLMVRLSYPPKAWSDWKLFAIIEHIVYILSDGSHSYYSCCAHSDVSLRHKFYT